MRHSAKADYISEVSPGITSALNAIINDYRSLIADDPILKADIAKLMRCITVSKSDTVAQCEHMINLVIAESGETAGDDDRIANESPTGENDNSAESTDLQKYRELQQALKNFRATYLTVHA
jgi:hypothetical protein